MNKITTHILDILKAYARVEELSPEELKALHNDAAGVIADMENETLYADYRT